MNFQQMMLAAELVQKLSASPVMDELKKSPAFQQFEKQMAPMKDDLMKVFFGSIPGQEEQSQEKEEVHASVGLDAMITAYEAMINHHFKHANGDTYALLAITNAASEDQVKFPTTAVYVSLTTAENWSRPLVDFSAKFTLI